MTPSTETAFAVDNIRPLDQKHDRAAFSCGDTRLDTYLRENAFSDVHRDLAVVSVWSRPPSQQVMGYYTLSPIEIDAGELPEVIRKKLRGRRVGATLLGRFAIHSSLQSQGFGKILFMRTLRDVVRASEIVSSVGVILDARTEAAKSFWARRRFVPLGRRENGSERFFLPISYIRDICSS